jgi:hypothetical protein
MKKIMISFIFACAMLCCILPLQVDAVAGDTKAPIITSIEYSSNAVGIGQNANIRVSITEDSSVAEIQATFLLKSDPSVTFVLTQKNPTIDTTVGNNPYLIATTIPDSQTTGEYYLSSLSATDELGNKAVYTLSKSTSYSYNDVNFTSSFYLDKNLLIMSGTDTTAPTVSSISLGTTASYNRGDAISINIAAADDLSGISRIDITFSKDSNNNFSIYKDFSPAPSSVTSISSTIPSDAASGEYSISAVSIKDLCNNSKYFTAEEIAGFNIGKLNVLSNGDDTAPTVESIKLITDKVVKGHQAAAEITYTEEKNLQSIEMMYTKEGNQGNISLRYDNNNQSTAVTSLTSNKLLVKTSTEFATVGTYNAELVTIKDTSGNKTVYSSDPQQGSGYLPLSNIESDLSKLTIVVTDTEPSVSLEKSLTDADLISAIKGAGNSDKIKIDGNADVVPAEVFSAVLGTNKTLDISRNGLEYIIDALDIDESQISDLTIKDFAISQVSGANYSNTNDIVKVIVSKVTSMESIRQNYARIRFQSTYLAGVITESAPLKIYDQDCNDNSSYFPITKDANGYFEFKTTYPSIYLLSAGVCTKPAPTQEDRTNYPKVTKITFENSSAEAGSSVNVKFTVTHPEAIGISSINFVLMKEGGQSYPQGQKNFNPLNFDSEITIPVSLPDATEAGTYYVGYLDIKDKDGNTRTYQYIDGMLRDSTEKTVTISDVQTLNIAANEAAKATKPEIKNIKFLQTEAAKGTTANVQFEVVTTDVGIKSVNLSFLNQAHPSEDSGLYGYQYLGTNGVYSGNVVVPITINRTALLGKCNLNYISVTDTKGNNWNYTSEEINKNIDATANYINILTDGDESAPEITKIDIITDTVLRPDVAEIRVDYKDRGYGISTIYASCRNSSDQSISFQYYSYKPNSDISDISGTIAIRVPIAPNQTVGQYMLSYVMIKDQSGNSSTYSSSTANLDELVVSNRNKIDVVENKELKSTSLSYTKLAEFITKQDNSAIIKITADRRVVPEEVFKAIIGTNKTIQIEDNGIIWVFKGIDITEANCKDIDITTHLNVMKDPTDPTKMDVVQLVFPENGVLPGKVKMRLKANYLSTLYNLKNGLLLYFDKGTALEKQQNTTFTMSEDGFLEFELTHNSTYYISDHAITTAPKELSELNKITETTETKQTTEATKNTTSNSAQESLKNPTLSQDTATSEKITDSAAPDTNDGTSIGLDFAVMVYALLTVACCLAFKKKLYKN